MRVLHIIDTLNCGGAERVCLNLIKLLNDAGDQADCLVISSRGILFNEADSRSTLFFLGRKSKFNLKAMHKCASIASQYDIVHVHMRHTWAYVKLSSLLFGKIKGLVFHDHFGDISIDQKVPVRLSRIMKPRFYIGASTALTEWAREKLRIKKDSVFLLGNTILPTSESSDRYSGDWVMVSNIRSTKNILFGVELAERFRQRLVIFGNHDNTSYSDQVFDRTRNSEYAVIIQNETNPQKYLKNFRLALHTSISESGPLVLLEYLAQGLPFIVYNSGEVVEMVKDDLPEMIVYSLDESEWVNKIEKLQQAVTSDDGQLEQKMKYLFNKKFSPVTYLNQCKEIYQSILNY